MILPMEDVTVSILRRMFLIVLGVVSTFLALDCLFPQIWLWLRLPGGFLFEDLLSRTVLVRSLLFLLFLFFASVLIALGVENDSLPIHDQTSKSHYLIIS